MNGPGPDVDVRVDVNGDGAVRDLNRLRGAIGGVGTAVGAIAGTAAAAGLGALLVLAARTNTEFQKLNVQLEVATGSAAGAKGVFSAIQALAAKTPFAVAELTSAFITLKNLGLDPSTAALISYGNTASAMGKTLDQVIQAVADAATGEFERLKEFGIKARKQGDDVAFTFKGVTEVVANNSAAIEGYLRRIGDTDFAGGMEKQSKTLGGALSNLGDNVNTLLQKFGEGGFNAALAETLKLLGEGTKDSGEFASELGGLAGDAISAANDVLSGFTSISDGAAAMVADVRIELAGLSVLGDVFDPLVDAATAAFSLVGGRADFFAASLRSTMVELDAINNFGARFLGTARSTLAADFDARRTTKRTEVDAARYDRQLGIAAANFDALRGDEKTKQDPAIAAAARAKAAAERTAAAAAKEAGRARKDALADGKRLADADADRAAALERSIALLEDQAATSQTLGALSEAQVKIVDLEAARRKELSALDRQRVVDATELLALNRSLADAARAIVDVSPASIAANAADADARRAADPLGRLVAGIDAGRDAGSAATDFGRAAGDGFNSSLAEAASAIGTLIGGKAGSAIGRIAGGLQSLGGRGIGGGGFGATFTTAFAAENKKLFDGVTGKLESVFGGKGGAFAATAGKAFAGAAQGQIAGSVLKGLGVKSSNAGSQLGGAAGAFLPIPGGALIGGVVGGILGGLLKKTRTGSASIDLAGGVASQSTSGNNAALKTAASARAGSVLSGLEAIAAQFGGELGSAKVSIGQRDKKFVVDTSGAGKTKGSGTTKYATEAEAVQAALADAIRDGGVAGVSPRVQAVLRQYADNVDKGVAEALKVAGLEELLANDANPFASVFRDLERQNAARLDAARQYGFDLAQIEAINAKDRAAALKATLDAATSSVRAVLDDFKFGSRATGSVDEQRSALAAERDRLAAAVRGGDDESLGSLTGVVQQLDDLTKSAFGSTGAFAAERASGVALLDELVRSVEARINAAASAAQASGGSSATTDPSVAKLTELNASADDQVALLARIAAGVERTAVPIATGASTSLAATYARFAQ